MRLLLTSVLILFIAGCVNQKENSDANLSLFEQARKRSWEIIEDVPSSDFIKHFRNNPHFDTAHVLIVQSQLINECKVDPGQITYYDYFKEIVRDSADVDVIDFFYEGPSACVDLRYRVGYIIHKKSKVLELFAFKVEPAAKPNDFINLIQNRRASEIQKKDSITP